MKYNRNYALFVQRNDGKDMRITLPLTVEFEIARNSFSSANVASFRIYNLAPESRTQIRKDSQDWGNIKQVSFAAGYGDKLALGFSGNISQAWSERVGPNFITQIESYDGGYAYVNAVASEQFQAGTKRVSMIEAVLKGLPGVKRGAIGNFEDTISRGNSVSGNSMKVINDISDGNAFIDNGKLHVLNDDEAIEGPMLVINHKSGLLGTPKRENTYITIEMLFEPALRVGGLVKLESITSEHFTGIHRVLAIRHRGTISEVVSGSVTTSVTLLPGQFAPVREGT